MGIKAKRLHAVCPSRAAGEERDSCAHVRSISPLKLLQRPLLKAHRPLSLSSGEPFPPALFTPPLPRTQHFPLLTGVLKTRNSSGLIKN